LILRIVIKMTRPDPQPDVAPERRRAREGARADLSTATAALSAHIERRGLKHSRQRERIAQTFFGVDGHVTIEELVARARKDDPRVSVATVYRTMKLLVECGLASARQFGDGQTRYEPSAGRAHHDHLICTGCGAIVEFANERIETLQETVARRHGFEVETHKLELYGRCAACRRGARGEDRP
jgi:Fur family ferric uptake transcriptional regulator